MTEQKSMNVIAKGAFILLIGAIIGKILSFLYRIILARLGEQTYGEISLALSLLSILSVIAVLGLDTGIVRYISLFHKDQNKAGIKGTILFSAKTILIMSTIFAIFLFLLSDWITATFYPNAQNINLILKIIAIALPFEGLKAVWTNTLKALKKIEYDIYARIIGEMIIRIILTILFIYLGLGILGAALAYTISIIFSSMVLFIFVEKKAFSFLDKNITALKENKEIFFYSLPLVFNSITIIVINAADSLVLGYFKDAATVGIYNVAIPTAKLILIFPTALLGLYLPMIALIKDNKEEFEKMYYTTTKWVFFITALSLAWLILYGKQLITIFFTESYTTAYSSLIILSIGYLINSCTYTSRDILLLFNKTKTIFIATTLACTINIILNFMLVPKYGMEGAAFATALSLTILSAILFIQAKRETKINPIKKRTFVTGILITISAIITYNITKGIQLDAKIILLSSIILITGISFTLMYITGIFEQEDKDMAKTILNKIKTTLKWKTSKESFKE